MQEEKKRYLISVSSGAMLKERQTRINKARAKAGKRKLTLGEVAECALSNLSVEQGFNY